MVSISCDQGIRLNCFDSIEEGARLILKFELDSIDHPVFGQSPKLCGQFELFNSNGSYPISSYFRLTKEEQEDLVKYHVTAFRKAFDHLTDDDLDKTVRERLIMTALCSPRLDAKSELFKFCTSALLVAFRTDDALEDHPALDNMKFIYKNLINDKFNFAEVMNREKREILVKRIATYIDGMEDLIYSGEKYFDQIEAEGLKFEMKEWGKAATLTLESIMLCRVATICPNLIFTNETWKFIREHEGGGATYGELGCLLRQFIVPKHIRKTILFQLFLKGVRDFAGQLNDILGLGKDIRTNENPLKNVILRRILNENISIDESFSQHLTLLLGTVQDMKVIGKLLQEVFPGDKNLAGYIETFFDSCDGQALSYLVSSQINGRYGSFNIKLVSDA